MQTIKNGLFGFLGGMAALGAFSFWSHAQQEDVVANVSSNTKQFHQFDLDINKEPQAHPVHFNKDIPQQTENMSDAAEMAVEAVVHINILQVKERYRTYYDPFRKFMGKNPYFKKRLQDGVKKGSGSGVIISENGYIVTNNHVIDQATEIEVRLNNNQTYKASVTGTDPNTDLAVLKINAKGLNYLPFGNSDDVRVGEWVLAVGNPFNLTSTVTAGIISAKGRSINLLNQPFAVESFIQTDAAINPGNSGGALVNRHGQLIGINTAISSHTGSYEGYAFAVPSNITQKVAEDIITYGKHQRALIGISCRTMDNLISDHYNIDYTQGVIIEKIQRGSNADRGGIRLKDIITKIGGKKIENVSDLQESMIAFRPGDNITLEVKREDQLEELEFTLQ